MSSQVVHVIDDDVDVRQSLAFLLSTAGLAVRVHDSATTFLQLLQDIQDGCVVTDIRMPGMDGLQLQKRLAELRPRLPVIVMTGHGDVPLAVQAMKAGAVDFIEKPFDDEVLLAAIRSALARHARDTEHESRVAAITARLALLSEREREGVEGPGRRQAQQGDRLRSRHQRPDRRGLPRQRHDQDAGRQPVGAGADGLGDRAARQDPGPDGRRGNLKAVSAQRLPSATGTRFSSTKTCQFALGQFARFAELEQGSVREHDTGGQGNRAVLKGQAGREAQREAQRQVPAAPHDLFGQDARGSCDVSSS